MPISSSNLDQLVEKKRILKDPLNRFDQNRTQIKAGNIASKDF